MRSQHNRAKENISYKTKKNFTGFYIEDDPNLLNLGMDSCIPHLHRTHRDVSIVTTIIILIAVFQNVRILSHNFFLNGCPH